MPKQKTTILYTLVVPMLIFGLAAAFPGCKEDPFKDVELEFWGVFDDSDVFSQLIDEFNEEYKHITIQEELPDL